jgi:hypothetical protein
MAYTTRASTSSGPFIEAGVAELVDAPDSKSGGHWSCEFDSRPRHHTTLINDNRLQQACGGSGWKVSAQPALSGCIIRA